MATWIEHIETGLFDSKNKEKQRKKNATKFRSTSKSISKFIATTWSNYKNMFDA